MVTQIDYAILNYIQNLRNPFLDTIMPYITYLGSGGTLWIAITVILLIRAKTRKIGITSALALVISAAVFILGVKNIVARERPFNQAAGLFDSASLLIFPPSDRYSFPSGHTVSSFASAMAIFI